MAALVFDKVRVLDLTQAIAGPYSAMLLGDFGADVIKIERPRTGDQSRGWGPPFLQSESTYFLAANRNKRSLTLDLDHPSGQEVLRRLVQTAAVLLINQPSRASLVKRRLDYESLAALNPGLVYASITGYGFSGPKAGRPGYDLIAQGEGGVMSFTGEPEGAPMRYPIPLADITTGLYATIGILMALLERQQTGRGQFLDLALFDSQLTWLSNVGSDYLNAGQPPRRLGNAHPSIVPYQPFRGSDGRYFMAAVGSEALWERFCRLLGISEGIGRDPRFATNRLRNEHRGKLVPLLQEIIETHPADYWLERLYAESIPAGPIQSAAEALESEQARARGMIVELEHPLLGVVRSIGNPIKMSGGGVSYRRPPPMLGEHTRSILAELGIAGSEIEQMAVQGVV